MLCLKLVIINLYLKAHTCTDKQNQRGDLILEKISSQRESDDKSCGVLSDPSAQLQMSMSWQSHVTRCRMARRPSMRSVGPLKRWRSVGRLDAAGEAGTGRAKGAGFTGVLSCDCARGRT